MKNWIQTSRIHVKKPVGNSSPPEISAIRRWRQDPWDKLAGETTQMIALYLLVGDHVWIQNIEIDCSYINLWPLHGNTCICATNPCTNAHTHKHTTGFLSTNAIQNIQNPKLANLNIQDIIREAWNQKNELLNLVIFLCYSIIWWLHSRIWWAALIRLSAFFFKKKRRRGCQIGRVVWECEGGAGGGDNLFWHCEGLNRKAWSMTNW